MDKKDHFLNVNCIAALSKEYAGAASPARAPISAQRGCGAGFHTDMLVDKPKESQVKRHMIS